MNIEPVDTGLERLDPYDVAKELMSQLTADTLIAFGFYCKVDNSGAIVIYTPVSYTCVHTGRYGTMMETATIATIT